MNDPRERRAALALTVNPRRTLDLAVEQRLTLPGTGILLRYVPDQHLLEPAACGGYVGQLGATDWPNLSALACAVFEDINSELVPRWLALLAARGDERVVLQETRPNWSNPDLLACLQPW